MRASPPPSPCMARDSGIGYQRQSTVIKSNQGSSEGHQRSSCTCVATWLACHCLLWEASASSRHVIITTVSY